MKVAKDFRYEAREALRGNWVIAVIVGIVGTILGANTIMARNGFQLELEEDTLNQIMAGSTEQMQAMILAYIGIMSTVTIVAGIAHLIIAGPITLGYVGFNLKMLDGESVQFTDLFSGFSRFKEGLSMHFFRMLFILLWTLAGVGISFVLAFICIFISPVLGKGVMLIGILATEIFIVVKRYDYALAPYIVYEFPEIGGREALKKSMQLMNGNRWRLFCLMFSFIGWALLATFLTCGLGLLVLLPYQEAAYAAFYRQIMTERNRSYRIPPSYDENGEEKEIESVVSNYRWNY
ncbi:MAG: DUF975 family protein [Lachnospiraceae bacterium]|nr:DUF975 family protein [Lachnospiraceae bacterium]